MEEAMVTNTNGDTKDMEEGGCVCKRWPQGILVELRIK